MLDLLTDPLGVRPICRDQCRFHRCCLERILRESVVDEEVLDHWKTRAGAFTHACQYYGNQGLPETCQGKAGCRFDTAFHQTMPKWAYLMLCLLSCIKYKIRRYGSRYPHRYVSDVNSLTALWQNEDDYLAFGERAVWRRWTAVKSSIYGFYLWRDW